MNRSGIVAIRERLIHYFEQNRVPAEVPPVGLKYRSFTLNQNPISGAGRVCLIPGVFDGQPNLTPRRYGVLTREILATHVSNPRELLAWKRPITISVWGAPIAGQEENEGASIENAETLLEQVVRALATGSFEASLEWSDVTLVAPPTESSFGAELLVTITQTAPFLDKGFEIAYPNLSVKRGSFT